MSCNRENVIWESKDGTWSRGFFDAHVWGENYEWDVDYDHDVFEWVSTGHPDWQTAHASWDGSNPGSHTRYAYADASDRCETFDRMAVECTAAYGAPQSSAYYVSW